MQLHYQLNPDLWHNNVLREGVRKKLRAIAQDFIGTLKIQTPPDDVTITGSSANYNYTSTSDIDLHVLIDFSTVDSGEELTRDYFLAKKSIWNDKHDITIFGREVEMYVQNTHEAHISTGVYSILHNKWVVKPQREDKEIDIDQEIFNKKLQEYVDIIEHNLNKNTNHKYLGKLRKKISDFRKAGLAADGEFSIENLVFKRLRSMGYLDKLAQHETDAYDASMSVESFKIFYNTNCCLLYTSPSPRDRQKSRMPSSA